MMISPVLLFERLARSLFFFLALAMLPGISSSWGLEVDGHLQWAEKRALSFPVSGVIAEIHVQVGDYVEAGAILASLESASYSARAKAAAAVLAQHADEQQEAKRELQRNQELYEQALLADRDLQQAQIQWAKAHAAYSQAQASVIQAQWELNHSVLRAPFPALVLERRAEPAETVIARCLAPVVLVLAAKDRMHALAQVEQAVLGNVRQGQEVTVLLGQQSLLGRVLRIGLEPVAAGEGTVQYAVEIAIPSLPAEGVRAGQAVRIRL